MHGTKSKYNYALAVSKSRTVSPLCSDFLLPGVSIRIRLNLDILGVKFDSKQIFEDHVGSSLNRVTRRIGILRLTKRNFLDSVLLRFYYAFVLLIQIIVLLVISCRLSPSASQAPGGFCCIWLCPVQDFLWLSHRRHIVRLCCTRFFRS